MVSILGSSSFTCDGNGVRTRRILRGNRIEVSGRFARETAYTVRLAPTVMRDRTGRPLELTGPSEVHLYFARKDPYLKWTSGQGILEQKGPKKVPIEGETAKHASPAVISPSLSDARSEALKEDQ